MKLRSYCLRVGVGAWGALATLVALETNAFALAEFAQVLSDRGWPVAKDCSVCHTSATGGGARTPFGESILSAGVATADKLNSVLDTDTNDTDGDGVKDTDELFVNFTNPSIKDAGAPPVEAGVTPEYGCGGSIAGHQRTSDGVGLLAGLFIGAALWRSRSRR